MAGFEIAAEALESADSVFLEDCCGHPCTIADAIAEVTGRPTAARRPPLLVRTGFVPSRPVFAPSVKSGAIRILTTHPGHGLGDVDVEYVPLGYNGSAHAYRSGRMQTSVAAVSVTSAGTLGVQSGVTPDALDATRRAGGTVIAERNSELPHVEGAPEVDLTGAIVIESSRTPMQLASRRASPAQTAAARLAATLVPAGACVEIGLGALCDEVLRALAEAPPRRLSFHSGMLGEGIVDLAESGVEVVATPIGGAPFTTSLLLGTQRLFRWAAQDARVRIRPTDDVHTPQAAAAIDGFSAINSALEIDLLGNVGAECLDGSRLSGPGGQLDFAVGAAKAPGGRSIFVLTSESRLATTRIVPRLSGPVTTPAPLVELVVTEHGVADLAGQTASARAEALTAIAAPGHRDTLREEFERVAV